MTTTRARALSDPALWPVWRLKGIAPSKELRGWYGHDPSKREEFVRRYRAELAQDDHAESLAKLCSLLAEGPVTLLTATKDLSLSQATVMADEVG